MRCGWSIWFVVLLVILLAGCGGKVPEVTPAMVAVAHARWPAADAVSLQRGRDVLTTRCTKCHAAPLPISHSEDEWAYYLIEMSKRAELDQAQHDELWQFLLAARDPAAVRPAPTP